MKRVILLFLVFAGLTFGSCRRQTVMPQFDIVVTDTVAVRGGIPCRFQYAFTSIANADEAPALQAIQESNMLYFFGLEHFQGGVQEAVDWSIGQFMDEYIGTLDESVPQWETEMEMAVESEARVVDTLLVYTISSSNYTGGAHGMYSINCHNYSIAGGYELALSDLFDAARQEALIGLIRNKLYEQFGVTGDEGLVAQGFFPEYISTTENFEVTEDGITFYYNPYDIGCYALGGVEVLGILRMAGRTVPVGLPGRHFHGQCRRIVADGLFAGDAGRRNCVVAVERRILRRIHYLFHFFFRRGADA